MAEFDTNPDVFAARYYGRNGIDSYPVQTHVARNLERLYYHESRVEERLRELAELELRLVTLEEEVLIEVRRMRTTSGWVRWPRRLPKFTKYRADFERHMLSADEMSRLERARDDVEFERLLAAEEARAQAQSDRNDVRLRKDLTALNPEEYARYRAWADYLSNGLRSGAIKMEEVIEYLRSA